jgi:hypothetical protein
MKELRHITVAKYLVVCSLAKELNRRPKASEVMQRLHCSRKCAYNYLDTFDYIEGTMLA